MDDLISFSDHSKRRDLIYNSVKDATIDKFPISNDRYTLEIADVDYDKKANSHFSLKDQKQAILEGRSLTRPLKGRFILKDNATGSVLEKGSLRTLANVPYLTRRGTFVNNGTESVLINQMRMVPGAYSKKTNDGKYETMVNVKQGTGKAFKLSLDPKTSQFHFKVGANKIPAYPIMNAMGITDDNLEQAWGKEILNKNKSVNIQRSLNTAYKQFFNKQVNDV